MTCGSAREYLFAFLDNELDAPLSIELQRHLDGCPNCARQAEIERTVRRRLRKTVDSSMTDVPVLEDAFSRVGLTEDAVGEESVAPTAGIPTGRIVSRRWPLAAAAALTITVGVWVTIRGEMEGGDGLGFTDLLVDDFQHFLDEGSHVQIASSDPDTVAEWLRERTTLAIVLPTTFGQRMRLLGGRKCKIDGWPAAFTVYDLNGVPASFVAAAAEHVDLEGMTDVHRNGADYWLDHRRGYTVVACRRDELVYAAVSMAGEEELVKLMMGALNESH